MVRRRPTLDCPVCPKWVGIRRIASRLVARDGNEGSAYERYIEVLTTRAVQNDFWVTVASVCRGHRQLHGCDGSYSDSEEEYDLMAAAAYMNKLCLMEQLLVNKHNLGVTAGSFGNAYIAVVTGGNAAALDLLFGNLRAHGLNDVKNLIFFRRGKVWFA